MRGHESGWAVNVSGHGGLGGGRLVPGVRVWGRRGGGLLSPGRERGPGAGGRCWCVGAASSAGERQPKLDVGAAGPKGDGVLHGPGIEPGPPAWQARILPLNHPCTGGRRHQAPPQRRSPPAARHWSRPCGAISSIRASRRTGQLEERLRGPGGRSGAGAVGGGCGAGRPGGAVAPVRRGAEEPRQSGAASAHPAPCVRPRAAATLPASPEEARSRAQPGPRSSANEGRRSVAGDVPFDDPRARAQVPWAAGFPAGALGAWPCAGANSAACRARAGQCRTGQGRAGCEGRGVGAAVGAAGWGAPPRPPAAERRSGQETRWA